MWNDKRYHTLDYELKKVFGEKAIKLSIDGNFTCPNRDGKISDKGCIFCSERGSGDFTSDRTKTISTQICEQKEFMSKKWVSNTYIAYFQNYTNTYDSVENLRIKFYEALSCPNIKGLAIATRPDCINKEIVELLHEINSKTFLWIELGLQTINEETSMFIRRGYKLAAFDTAVNLLTESNIRVVAHLIIGLPNETKQQILKSAKYIDNLNLWGIKLHMLHILKNTDLEKYFNKNCFHMLSQDEYVDIICDILELLNSNIIIHRLTGDGKKSDLIAPLWSLNKLKVLSEIDRELKYRQSIQGIKSAL
ncbi:radical SAM protein (TIGR01212 family) [Sedimentibacter acidaminivorans]|uniref:Radical SAM protein (TIGR01212 family) n=1 Tax=Sedimentibacter acidaminivorans TaxID=913099 RepID=A0ABS4GHN9_9FIRM|nr:TIGR01212 family radical SAM protein [Sedimentibacter acidaminivorans]MBP1926895.1 radical SAM protein (TIGR01212 family) [Sedimentibacter acidaminivorans]